MRSHKLEPVKPDSGRIRHVLCARALSIALSIALSLSIPAITASQARADVRKSDRIAYATLEDRAVPASFAPNIDSKYAYLKDSDGNVYFGRDCDAEVPIASVTKIMTAIVALETAPLDSKISVSRKAAEIGESTSGLMAGDELILQNALIGLMVSSGNDAAVAIAESLGSIILEDAESSGIELAREDGSSISGWQENSSYDAFVSAMNRKAQELGLANTLFTNPHGLDFGQFEGREHSTARDVEAMAEYAMQNETFRDIVKMREATLPVKRDGRVLEIEIESTDTFLGSYDGACGIKTGFTDRAGNCFVGACDRGGTYLYSVVLGSSTHEQRFEDTETLFNWVYDNQIDLELANSDVTCDMDVDGQIASVPVVAYVPLADWIDKTVPATFADANASVEVSAILGNVSQDIQLDEVRGPVSAGQKVGRADFYQDNELIASQDIVACQDVAAPDIMESIGIGWQRFMNNFSGASNVSDPEILNTLPMILEKS